MGVLFSAAGVDLSRFSQNPGMHYRRLTAFAPVTSHESLYTSLTQLQLSPSAILPGSPKRAPHVRSVQVFPQVHKRQKRAQNSRLQIIGQVQAAGSHPRQPLTAFCNKSHDFLLPVVRSVPQRRLAPHFRAASLDR